MLVLSSCGSKEISIKEQESLAKEFITSITRASMTAEEMERKRILNADIEDIWVNFEQLGITNSLAAQFLNPNVFTYSDGYTDHDTIGQQIHYHIGPLLVYLDGYEYSDFNFDYYEDGAIIVKIKEESKDKGLLSWLSEEDVLLMIYTTIVEKEPKIFKITIPPFTHESINTFVSNRELIEQAGSLEDSMASWKAMLNSQDELAKTPFVHLQRDFQKWNSHSGMDLEIPLQVDGELATLKVGRDTPNGLKTSIYDPSKEIVWDINLINDVGYLFDEYGELEDGLNLFVKSYDLDSDGTDELFFVISDLESKTYVLVYAYLAEAIGDNDSPFYNALFEFGQLDVIIDGNFLLLPREYREDSLDIFMIEDGMMYYVPYK